MSNIRTERKAIYLTATIFTDLGWIFREQPLVDYGIDALVETTEKGRPNGKFIALQIKGGEHNFHRKKEYLTFYFNENHYNYWTSISETLPLIIILHDPVSNNIYWEIFSFEKSIRTTKHWKIDVSKNNILNKTSIKRIHQIIIEKKNSLPPIIEKSWFQQSNSLNKKLNLYLHKKKNQLHLSIDLQHEFHVINLRYALTKKNWNEANQELHSNDRFYFTMRNLKKLIESKIEKTNPNEELKILIHTLTSLADDDGINKIQEYLFDLNNEVYDLPKFKYFVQAFEYYSKLKKHDYEIETLDQVVLFKTKDEVYEMDTYEGKIARLKYFIEEKSYEEIYTMTDNSIWNEIYIDAGIEKSKFVPIMLNLWKTYWEELFTEIKNRIGYTSHLEKLKERSWRELNIFFNTYDDTSDIIDLAYEINEMKIYPLAVATMMAIFNPDVCYSEYCELEFELLNDWESICVNDSMDSTILHIRLSELY